MKKVDIPKLSVEQKYRLLGDFYEGFMMSLMEQIAPKLGLGLTKVLILTALKGGAHFAGGKIKREFKLGQDLESAIKLLGIYYGEVLGCRHEEFVEQNEAVSHISFCPLWEKGFKSMRMDCEPMCVAGIRSLAETLSENFNVKMNSAFPRGGDDCCEFVVTLSSKNDKVFNQTQ